MPEPLTPLSQCPLKQLEIYDSSASRVYGAAQIATALTLSFEAERSLYEGGNDLVLQVHCGPQRVVSLKLTDLLQSTSDISDSVSVERRLYQLCIEARRQKQRILATFAEARDFNVAVCMLKRLGLQVKDGIPPPCYARESPRSTPVLYTVPLVADLGPRLSSIPPLSWPGSQSESQNSSSFSLASMPNSQATPQYPSNNVYDHFNRSASPIPSQQMPAPLVQNHHALQLNQQSVQSTIYNSHLNPYNVFPGKQFNQPHQPWAASPLRNSLNIEGPGIPSAENCDKPFYSNRSAPRVTQSAPSISVPTDPPDSSESSKFFSASQPENTHLVDSQENSQTSSYEGLFPGRKETQGYPQPHINQNIHELMPQPRNLPFAKRKKTANIKKVSPPKPKQRSKPKPKPKPKENKSSKAKQKSVPASPAMTSVNKRQGRKDNLAVHHEQDRRNEKQTTPSENKNKSKIECQKTSSSPNINPRPLLDTPSQKASSELTMVPTMLVADPSLLQEVNKATLKLLDQYDADIARGCDEVASARFYVERIHSARRDFWVSRLMDMERGEQLAVMN